MPKQFSEAPLELQAVIEEFWPYEEWENAANIAFLESGWNALAVNDTVTENSPCGAVIDRRGGVAITAERSVGYFQINSCNYPEWNPWHFFNGRHNAGTAHALWDTRGWQPWYFSARKLGLLT